MGFVPGIFTAVVAATAVAASAEPGHPSQKFGHCRSPPLPQWKTNGASTLGTLNHLPLPPFINGPKPGGSPFPWGGRTCENTNPYQSKDIPYTGMTRYYDWTVTNTTLAPDGVMTPALVVNGQFPGPLIEANWEDEIVVNVYNALVTEGTAIHWHGFLQSGTPWYDECPIAPEQTFAYKFRAELYDVNGLAGPIVVHGPKTHDYDIDIGPVMLSDWYHSYYLSLLEQIYHAAPTGPILPPMADNMLINDKPTTPDAGLASFKFKTGKRHLLRLINHSAEAIIFFSIYGYKLTVVSNDFVPLVPYQTDLITLSVGQRTEVIVQGGNDPHEAVWMRITEGLSGLGPPGNTGCGLNTGVAYETTASIYYEQADTTVDPVTTSSIDPGRSLFPNACGNNDLSTTVPAFVMPANDPEFVWYMNNVTYQGDLNDPLFLDAKLGKTDFKPTDQVINLGTAKAVRIVLTSVGFPASHPMHIHGHNFYVLAEGLGPWDGMTIINQANPQRRDVQRIRPNGYLVVQIDLENPGMWTFHCHVAWHASEGMNINILEQVPTIVNDLQVPATIAEGCREWWSWTNVNVVDQIDSGL
ncbi:hypothetical protein B0A48_01790 [Cryoendolithus antarcticus]|uniref:Laccase-2 n=1 Tax=Cryoendolithus antarcticus TaxID=1507870 RepID=A0A1V8TQN9_9PEZI|nr:hypothetical protein B0A48_01790 [Cryoendolithus antarcticus]